MKKYVLGILLLSQVSAVIAQNNTANTLQSVINKTVLSNSDISNGLKEALTIGATKASGQLAVLNGFYKDSLVKILMPAEAEVVSTQLKKLDWVI